MDSLALKFDSVMGWANDDGDEPAPLVGDAFPSSSKIAPDLVSPAGSTKSRIPQSPSFVRPLQPILEEVVDHFLREEGVKNDRVLETSGSESTSDTDSLKPEVMRLQLRHPPGLL
jgi:hypothetical protein